MGSIRLSTVPTGDVDSRMTRSPFFSRGTTLRVALSTKRISAFLSSVMGVGTEMM